MSEKLRIVSSPEKPRRLTRKSALPLAFDGKHLKKLLDHYCTAEQLDSWVQSSPVVDILKQWVKSTLQCAEHADIYRELLLPAETDETWSDFKEDCVHLAFTRIRGEHPGEPEPDAVTQAWSEAIVQLVRDSWKDTASGPLNGGQQPGYFDGWPCERACDLLQTVYEELRKTPTNGYFANLLGAFTGQCHLASQPKPDTTAPKQACETCRFNHIACDRAEPICGQCKHSKILCTRPTNYVSDHTGDTTDEEPLRRVLPRLMPKPFPIEAAAEPPLFEIQLEEPNLPACKTCRLKYRGCDRVRPVCGECALRGVFCIWDRDVGSRASREVKAGTDYTTLEERAIDENNYIAKFPPQSGSKRASGANESDVPAKRSRLSLNDTPAPTTLQLPGSIRNTPGVTEEILYQAPIAPMLAPLPPVLSIQAIQPSTLGKVHSDRLAQIGKPPSSPLAPLPKPLMDNTRPENNSKRKKKGGGNANLVELGTSRTVKVEYEEVSNGFAQQQPRIAPALFLAQISNPLQGAQSIQRPQTKRAADLPPAMNRPDGVPTCPKSSQSSPRPSSEEARLLSSLQYCKTLFEDVLAGRNPLSAAKMGVTAIQHALGKD
jgi:hypothetical protein